MRACERSGYTSYLVVFVLFVVSFFSPCQSLRVALTRLQPRRRKRPSLVTQSIVEDQAGLGRQSESGRASPSHRSPRLLVRPNFPE